MSNDTTHPMKTRFRGFFPVVIDVETTGLDATENGVLEIAAYSLTVDDKNQLSVDTDYFHTHVTPFEGAIFCPKAAEIHKIDIDHPLRFAISETDCLQQFFKWVRDKKKDTTCQRAVLVGHNAWFDLSFINAMVKRVDAKRNPFHPFTSFDTATLSAVAYGQTVLAKACKSAGIDFDPRDAHSALYDAEITAQLFCQIVNAWPSPNPDASAPLDQG